MGHESVKQKMVISGIIRLSRSARNFNGQKMIICAPFPFLGKAITKLGTKHMRVALHHLGALWCFFPNSKKLGAILKKYVPDFQANLVQNKAAFCGLYHLHMINIQKSS